MRTPLFALGLLLAACRPNPELAELPTVDDEETQPRTPSLDALADRLDPGAQPMLIEGTPPGVFEVLELEASPTASAAALRERSDREQASYDALLKDGVENDRELVRAIGHIARAVVLAEQAAAASDVTDPDTLARLERVYAAVDVPLLAGDRNAFGQFVTLFARAAAVDGAEPTDAALPQMLAGVVQHSVRAAGPLHRHTVAELVRTAPNHAAVPTALLAAAKARRGSSDAWPVEAAKAAIERVESPSPAQQLDLARVCYAGLDLPCGKRALAAADGAEGRAEVDELRTLAERIVALEGAETFADQLERAWALLELGRFDDAQQTFAALRESAPKDARPVTGLAKLAIETELDFMTANELIDGAGELDNATEGYYEIAIGTRATAALATTIPHAVSGDRKQTERLLRPLLERTLRDAKGYAALGNADGRYLVLVLGVGEELLDQYVAGGSVSLREVPDLTARVVELQSQIPTHGHSYRLLMSAALFEPDRTRALAAAGVQPPGGPQSEELAIRHARALCDLAVSWSDGGLAQQCLGEASRLKRSVGALWLQADASLTTAQLTDKVSWVKVAEAYELLLDEDMTAEDARALNNVGMALWRMGKHETAINAWNLSARLATEWADVPELNLALARTEDGSPEAIAAVEGFTGDGRSAGVKPIALAWLKAWAKGRAAKKRADAALREALEAESASAMRPSPPDPYAGVLLEGTLRASFGYAAKDGLQIQLDASGLPWAVLTPPR